MKNLNKEVSNIEALGKLNKGKCVIFGVDMAKDRDWSACIKIENSQTTALKDCILDIEASVGPKKKHERITLKEGDKKELN